MQVDAPMTYQGLICAVGTRCSRRITSSALASKWFGGLPGGLSVLYQRADEIERSRRLGKSDRLAAREAIADQLFIADLRSSLDTLGLAEFEYLRSEIDDFDPESFSGTAMPSRVTAALSNWGITQEPFEVTVVDDYPAPYSGRAAAAMAIDEGDRRDYGLTPGIYVKRDRIRPIYTEMIVAHEAIHWGLGLRDPFLTAEFIEEGIADTFGGLIYGSERFGESAARNSFILARQASNWGEGGWDKTLDGARAAFIAGGMSARGLLDLLEQGRAGLSAIERLAASGELPFTSLGDIPSSKLDQLLVNSLFGFPRFFVVSEVAFLVAQFALEGSTLAEIESAACLSSDLLEMGLSELESEGLLTRRLDKLVVATSLANQYFQNGVLRFKVDET